jgi:hypothetical protein
VLGLGGINSGGHSLNLLVDFAVSVSRLMMGSMVLLMGSFHMRLVVAIFGLVMVVIMMVAFMV